VPTAADLAQLIDGVEGWLTTAQAERLRNSASRCRENGRIVEIGSFRGRSAVVLGTFAPGSCEVVAIDPHAGNDRGPQEIEGFEAEAADDHTVFLRNLAERGLADRVRHVRKFSNDAHADVTDPIDVLYIDGAHRFGPARADIRDWGRRVPEGGTMLIHDAFCSVGVTLAILSAVTGRGQWRYEGRSGSLVEYRRIRLRGSGRARDAIRQIAVLPWFVRNVTIKVLITLRLRRVTRLLGHDPALPWPF
jgi:hypothetical protein